MTKKEKSELAIKIVEKSNPDMGGKWDTEMYRQKDLVMVEIDELEGIIKFFYKRLEK